MKSLTDQLSQYAAYHRDRRNIATHFFGVPMILFAVVALLSRPWWLALVVALATAAYYLRLDRRLGAAMTALLALALLSGHALAGLGLLPWLATSIGLFVVGWIIQFIGHLFEGRKPAFLDDLVGLLIGPLFVVAEAAFAVGLRKELEREIDASVGPTHIRRAQTTVQPG